jgi:SAM-dependent methyltransferase
MAPQPKLYHDLAWVWELMVADEDYRIEADLVADTLDRHVRSGGKTLLDVACGAGHHDQHLKERYQVTGVDLSPAMLELARHRNPGLRYEVGDMRGFRLGQEFDAVIILDALGYSATLQDLQQTLSACAAHLKPGGALLFYLEEAFSLKPHPQAESVSHTYRQGDTEVVVEEHSDDPDPTGTHYDYTFVYRIRRAGELTVEVDRHRMGLFDLAEVEATLQRLQLKVSRYRWPFGGDGGVGQGPLFVCEKQTA